MLNVAIAGGGFTAAVHARAALVNGARLLGVSASTPAGAARAAAALGARRAYPSNEDLVADPEVQVVHVCTPNHLHADLARAAIDAGKHVICEKPLATDLAAAADLQRRAEARGIVGTVPFVYRYYAMVREARERMRAGEIGRLTLIHGSYLQDWLLSPTGSNWRVDPALGGRSRAFADIGSHWCDLAEFVTADRIESVSGQFQIAVPHRPAQAGPGATFSPRRAGASAQVVPVSTEDIALVHFRTVAGILGSLVVSQVAAGHKNHLRLELSGTQSTLSFDLGRPDQLRLGDESGLRAIERDPAALSPAAARYSRLPAGHPQGYQDCVDAFVGETYAAIRGEGADPLLPTFATGVHAVAITEAVVRAAAAGGGWVRVPDPADELARA